MSKKLPNKKIPAYAALLFSTVVWGIATVVIKLTLQQIPLMTFLFYRFLIVGIVLFPIVWFELKKTPVNLKDIPTFILLGLLGQSGILLIFTGIKYTSAIDAAIIGAMAPLVIIGLGHYFYKDKINKKLELGLLIATIGILFVALEPILIASGTSGPVFLRVFGNLMVVLYNIVFALYIILSKKVMGQKSGNVSKTLKKLHIKPLKAKYSPFLHTAISFYVALASFIPLYILEASGLFGEYNFSILKIQPTPLAGLLYMALISSILAYTAFQWGLDHSRVSDSGVFSYLGAIFTLPAAYILLGEIPTTTVLIGAFIIMTGVVIAETRKT